MNMQLTFVQVEPAMEMVQMAEDMLKNYGWMSKEVERLTVELRSAGEGMGASDDPNANIRAQGTNSDKTGNEVVRRDRSWKRLEKMRKKVGLFEAAMETISDEQELTMLDYLLDGETVTKIACRLEVSRQRAHEVKRKLVRKLAWAMYDKQLPTRPTVGEVA